MKSDIKYLLALSQIEGLGPVNLKKLLDLFTGDAESCYQASSFDFQKLSVPPTIAELVIKHRNALNPEKLINQLIKEDIKIITYLDNSYPELLKEIYAAPLLLYYRGNPEVWEIFAQKNNLPTLAVVGSRKISDYGKIVMSAILPEIIRDGAVIISGLAFGVDSKAHYLALENGGQTLAVLGSGLAWDYLYPAGNKRLAREIIQKNGLLISEFSPFTRALKFNFPRRNRLISGLAQATLIVEASAKSGALITAKFALEQNREVLAIPGPITSPNSQGTNYLIQNGAKLVSTAADLRQSLGIVEVKNKGSLILPKVSDEELIILKILNKIPLQIDKIIENSTLDTAQVNALLLQLELKGLIQNLGGQNYISLI